MILSQLCLLYFVHFYAEVIVWAIVSWEISMKCEKWIKNCYMTCIVSLWSTFNLDVNGAPFFYDSLIKNSFCNKYKFISSHLDGFGMISLFLFYWLFLVWSMSTLSFIFLAMIYAERHCWVRFLEYWYEQLRCQTSIGWTNLPVSTKNVHCKWWALLTVASLFFLYSHCVWGEGHCSRQDKHFKGSWGDSGWISSEDWLCHAWCFQRERSRELVLLTHPA